MIGWNAYLYSIMSRVKEILIGRPIATHQTKEERLSNSQGLAIFASDSLSSTAYATEEILLVLAPLGAVAMGYSIPIAIAITLLILVEQSSG